MDEKDFQQKLGDLISQIDELPQTQQNAVRHLADQAKARHEKLRQTVQNLQESLDYLRLSIKYLVFDLEATRRENQYLRKMLESGNTGADQSGNQQE